MNSHALRSQSSIRATDAALSLTKSRNAALGASISSQKRIAGNWEPEALKRRLY
jgi:hypothetical protein